MQSEQTRGSRKHMLDWIDSGRFTEDLTQFLRSHDVALEHDPCWMPKGWDEPREARLDRDGDRLLHRPGLWTDLRGWWLKYPARGNTPNWDFAATIRIADRTGLALFEAKAHHGELHCGGKRLDPEASEKSKENHGQIHRAIEQARLGMLESLPRVDISVDVAYQLSNRIAVSWWLAKHGVPVLLVYLGFLGDSSVGRPFKDADDWSRAFSSYSSHVMPPEGIGRAIPSGEAFFRLVTTSRRI